MLMFVGAYLDVSWNNENPDLQVKAQNAHSQSVCDAARERLHIASESGDQAAYRSIQQTVDADCEKTSVDG